MFNMVPDLIQSSGGGEDMAQLDKKRDDHAKSTAYCEMGTIYPFPSGQRSVVDTMVRECASLLQEPEAKRVMVYLMVNFLGSVILLLWCHTTNSIALTAYTYLTIFDIFSVLVCLLSIWVQNQKPTPLFSFGYERFEVLAVFASTLLAQLGSLFILKESVERLLEQPEVHQGHLLPGCLFAFVLHLVITYGLNNDAMEHVISASTSSWLQEHAADMSHSLCHVVPGLSKFLLPRMNPLVLIAFTGAISLLFAYVLIDTKQFVAADTWVAVCIAVMICATMFPMSIYTGKILLQTTPPHMISQLDKILREVSTLDGVLEFRKEHFWTLSFGVMAGSLQVRIRRDADEQLVLAHVQDRLSNLVTTLTIQIVKDDWTQPMSFHMFPGSAGLSPLPRATSPSQEISHPWLSPYQYSPITSPLPHVDYTTPAPPYSHGHSH